jgi:hypothetical protein
MEKPFVEAPRMPFDPDRLKEQEDKKVRYINPKDMYTEVKIPF